MTFSSPAPAPAPVPSTPAVPPPAAPTQKGWRFFPGQLDYLARVATKDYALVAADTGTGKSLMSIALLRLKHRSPNGNPSWFSGRALICAPQGTVRCDEDCEDPGADEDDPKDTCAVSQWGAELSRFAPGTPVFSLMSPDDYHALVKRYGTLPDGVYLTYYEAMFKNGAKERLPETWDHKKLCTSLNFPLGPTYRQFMVDFYDGQAPSWIHQRIFTELPPTEPCHLAHPEKVRLGDMIGNGRVLNIVEHPIENYTAGIGTEQKGILCLAAPSLATLIDTDLAARDRVLGRAPGACAFDSVVLDEAHVISNLGAQITQAVIRLQPRHRFALTATPIPNILTNLFSIMGWLCVPDWYKGERRNVAWPYAREEIGTFAATFLSEERDYTQEERNEAAAAAKGKRWSGKCVKVSPVISSPARLLKLLKPSLAYVSKDACNPQVVPCQTIDVRVPMGPEQSALYTYFANRNNIPGKTARVKAANQLTYLRGVCADPKGLSAKSRRKGMACPPVSSNFNPKTQAALDLIYDCLNKGEPVVVISARHGQTDELYFRLAQAIGEDKLARIDATVLARNHAHEADRFKKGEARVMFMGLKCAKAYSFSHCPNLIVLSLEYSFGTLCQARGRVWRVNSKGSRRSLAQTPAEVRQAMGVNFVRVWCLLHKNSIEETMYDIVATKQDAATICLLGRRVPREYKPVDMEEVLAESLSRREDELLRIQQALLAGVPVKADPIESAAEALWPGMAANLTKTAKIPPRLLRMAHERTLESLT